MKRKTSFLYIILIMITLSCAQNKPKEPRLIDFVDPFIGTDYHGHTFPGATTPFGMVQLSPDNPVSGWDWASGYHWSSDTIAGFSHTHLSGTGIGDLLDVSVMPVLDFNREQAFSPGIFYSSFSHENEQAKPGYYKILLDNGINAELTATPHCGYHKYTWPEGEKAAIMFDLEFHQNKDWPYSTCIEKVSENSIQGFRFSTGWATDQKVYFYAEFSSPIESYILFDENNQPVSGNKAILENVTQEELKEIMASSIWTANKVRDSRLRKGVKAVLDFGVMKKPLFLKVGISSASIEGAKNNLLTEVGQKSFDSVKETAFADWEEILSKIIIESDDVSKKRTFYTAMYHSYIAPNTYSDVDGAYTGMDGKLKKNMNATNYFTFSLWDTYRALHPLITIIEPGKVNGFLEAFLMQYNEYGLLPVWSLWGNETNTMIGYHAIPVIVDAYFKGLIREELVEPLYNAMLQSANQEIRETPLYRKYGYIPADLARASVSTTLEYAYNDWCIAQMAKALGRDEDYKVFSERANSYRALFNKESKLMQPKLADGKWKEFDPFNASYGNDFTEANTFQYTWYVPHDVGGLIDLFGGKEQFELMLDSIFILPPEVGEDAAHDVSGFIGQYIHGNEPSHHIAYLYNYTGAPHKTQEKVNQILNEMYSDQPDGLCGNEDCGQMSAWYIFSSLGFYPVNPANGKYDLGRPDFPEAIIKAGDREFKIIAHNYSPDNIYVSKVMLNQAELNRHYITHEEIMNGGILEFYMAAEKQ